MMGSPKIVAATNSITELRFNAYDPVQNEILWLINFNDPLLKYNLNTLTHEYLHWILDNFINPETSKKLDNIEPIDLYLLLFRKLFR